MTFSNLFTYEIAEQWYLCQANFLLPCLVLLPMPLIFLIVIQGYTLLGVFIAFKKKEARVNSFILSLYPFFFHLCFIIFYVTDSLEIIQPTQLVCMACYLIGIIHHLLSFLYEILSFFVKLYNKFGKVSNSIQPILAKN